MKHMYLVPALSLLVPAVAFADQAAPTDASAFDHAVAAPTNSVEISVATGYTQGGGSIGNGVRDLDDVARAGGALELDVSYRVSRTFAVGVYGSLAKYDSATELADGTDVLGATAGIQATAHLRPERSIDPWISLGTGWKGLWLDAEESKTTSLHGLELVRLRVGVDYRLTKEISITPVIGGSLGMFLSQDAPMTDGYDEIHDKDVQVTGFGGIGGRFNVGG